MKRCGGNTSPNFNIWIINILFDLQKGAGGGGGGCVKFSVKKKRNITCTITNMIYILERSMCKRIQNVTNNNQVGELNTIKTIKKRRDQTGTHTHTRNKQKKFFV